MGKQQIFCNNLIDCDSIFLIEFTYMRVIFELVNLRKNIVRKYNDYADTNNLISHTRVRVIRLVSFDFYHTKVIYLLGLIIIYV